MVKEENLKFKVCVLVLKVFWGEIIMFFVVGDE